MTATLEAPVTATPAAPTNPPPPAKVPPRMFMSPVHGPVWVEQAEVLPHPSGRAVRIELKVSLTGDAAARFVEAAGEAHDGRLHLATAGIDEQLGRLPELDEVRRLEQLVADSRAKAAALDTETTTLVKHIVSEAKGAKLAIPDRKRHDQLTVEARATKHVLHVAEEDLRAARGRLAESRTATVARLRKEHSQATKQAEGDVTALLGELVIPAAADLHGIRMAAKHTNNHLLTQEGK